MNFHCKSTYRQTCAKQIEICFETFLFRKFFLCSILLFYLLKLNQPLAKHPVRGCSSLLDVIVLPNLVSTIKATGTHFTHDCNRCFSSCQGHLMFYQIKHVLVVEQSNEMKRPKTSSRSQS